MLYSAVCMNLCMSVRGIDHSEVCIISYVKQREAERGGGDRFAFTCCRLIALTNINLAVCLPASLLCVCSQGIDCSEIHKGGGGEGTATRTLVVSQNAEASLLPHLERDVLKQAAAAAAAGG